MMQCCQEIDLIICDIKLGNASGIDLVRDLRKSGRFSSIPIVAVTAGSLGQAPEAFAAGFNRYILKPIEPETFIAEINLCLDGEGTPGPARPIPTTAPPAFAGEFSAEQSATILAVDEKSANLDLVIALLAPLGHHVITARGVEEAIARARKDNPDLLLTDVHMGDGTGFDLIRAIQHDTTLKHIPWLVTSATYLSMDPRAKEIHLDDSNFILQPWDPQVLIEKIRKRLRSNEDRSRSKTAQAGR
jgi:two-component system cell cycle response regulator